MIIVCLVLAISLFIRADLVIITYCSNHIPDTQYKDAYTASTMYEILNIKVPIYY